MEEGKLAQGEKRKALLWRFIKKTQTEPNTNPTYKKQKSQILKKVLEHLGTLNSDRYLYIFISPLMSEAVEICIKEGFTEDCQHKEQ